MPTGHEGGGDCRERGGYWIGVLHTTLCATPAQTHTGQVDMEAEESEQGDGNRTLGEEQAGLLRGVLKDPKKNLAVQDCDTLAPPL